MSKLHVLRTDSRYNAAGVSSRSVDHVLTTGAAAANAIEAQRILVAILLSKAEILPGDYVEYDLYGRGDPHVFWVNSKHADRRAASMALKGIPSKSKRSLRIESVQTPAQTDFSRLESHIPKSRKAVDIGYRLTCRRAGADSSSVSNQKRDESKRWSTSSPPKTPLRVKSRLPSEEPIPLFEAGAVSRAIKFYNEEGHWSVSIEV